MFVDEATINVKAGKGGDGAVSFRHEKYIAKGGPDGGDGGNGGDIVIIADPHTSDLSYYSAVTSLKAKNGQNGMSKNMKGKRGEDLILSVPMGTQVISNGKVVFDAINKYEKKVIAKGGQGGWGNIRFKSSIKQAPRYSKKGLEGDILELNFELKTIADIGLIGFPNAGKSTLLSTITNAKPKIANYPFTTLEPNLGAIKLKDKTIILADIPGLIDGAAKGKGLGIKFLKHIERTKILVHLIDAISDDVVADYRCIRAELKEFSKELTGKKEVVVLNKSDVLNEDELDQRVKALKKIKVKPLIISAATSGGINEFKKVMMKSI